MYIFMAIMFHDTGLQQQTKRQYICHPFLRFVSKGKKKEKVTKKDRKKEWCKKSTSAVHAFPIIEKSILNI